MTLAQPPLWLIIIAFLAAIGPLVFIHEMGHYLAARRFGVGAESFSIGFGREVAGWTDRRGTRWKIGWLPLGGYVRFSGDMDPASMGRNLDRLSAEERARAFHAKPVWQRFLIVLAGPMANFLLAIAIFAAFFALSGVPNTPAVAADVMPDSAAARAGMVPGDRILAMNGRSIERFEDIADFTLLRPGEPVIIEIERQGRRDKLETTLDSAMEKNRFGETFRIGRLGIANPGRAFEKVGILRVVPLAVKATVGTTRSMIDGIGQIITGRRPVSELHGPMKMAQIAGQFASVGFFEFVQLVALFSINLGFINLLPVPMLDGGHLALYTVEAVRRRPLGERAQEWVFRGGIAALMTLLLLTTFNDLGSLGLWDRIGHLMG